MGIAWEAGLLLGLAGEGVDLAGADKVVGTSAGSVVGAQLGLGHDLADLSNLLADAVSRHPQASPAFTGGGIETIMRVMAEAVVDQASPQETRSRLGRVALDAPTMPEQVFVDLFSYLSGAPWPARFCCTAVDAATGEFVVWDAAAGADLQRAVASSCAVPGLFPPVSVGGRRYIDGGTRTPLNADLAAGHDSAVVVSCMILSLPEGLSDPAFDRMAAEIDAELAAVRDSGAKLEVVTPGDEFLDVSGWGLYLMDLTRVPAAVDAGRRQGVLEVERLGAVWGA